MKAFIFSDLHCSIKHLVKMHELVSSAEGKDIKALLFAGDVVNMGEPVWVAEDFVRTLRKIDLPFLWVPGNNDFGRAYHKLNANYKSLEGKEINLLGRKFTGVGGSPASWAGQYEGESMIDKKAIAGSIFISHVPPPGAHNWQHKDIPLPYPVILGQAESHDPGIQDSKNQLVDSRLRGNDTRKDWVGNESLAPKRRFADAPLIHICGHIHHQWGTAYLGQTKIIKLSSLETGHYAILDLEDLSVEFRRF